ncbi:NAD-dependent epimerase/dehydratase family protein [Parabacteroides sp. OttesenSCG-928-G07]|nr:NAD-dependent epimerase/dehydratase family protein [Parabacteroides sp. OttesenSCG-928-G21]MDL2277311.1 NAD-dependent epimerase/dehydratase family protein [Parabacteroides sp. OttesenSCG-928-G07]
MKVIITGSTGMVGEGVLLECLMNSAIKEILIVNRRPYEGKKNPKLTELIVPDFLDLEGVKEQLKGYDACFYCAGKSSVGMNEQDYTHITYDTVICFAETILSLNPGMTFCHVSGTSTDSTEKGKVMWARVKGKAENDLMKLPFKAVYNFRPALMKPTTGQIYLNGYNKMYPALYPVLRLFMPGKACTMQEIGQAMINGVLRGYPKHILEVKDIKQLAKK